MKECVTSAHMAPPSPVCLETLLIGTSVDAAHRCLSLAEDTLDSSIPARFTEPKRLPA
jgi:hypothetical protein